MSHLQLTLTNRHTEVTFLRIGSFMAAVRKARSEHGVTISFSCYSNEENNQKETKAGITPSSTPSKMVPNSSAAWATAAYLYLSLINFDGEWAPSGHIYSFNKSLRASANACKSHSNPRFLRWLLDWVRVRLDDGYEVVTRSYHDELWFWRVVIGAYTLRVAGSRSTVENLDEIVGDCDVGRRERNNLVYWYTKKLSERRQPTWALAWVGAKEVLEKIQWLQIPGSPVTVFSSRHGKTLLDTASASNEFNQAPVEYSLKRFL
jgi:hypothetical protein